MNSSSRSSRGGASSWIRGSRSRAGSARRSRRRSDRAGSAMTRRATLGTVALVLMLTIVAEADVSCSAEASTPPDSVRVSRSAASSAPSDSAASSKSVAVSLEPARYRLRETQRLAGSSDAALVEPSGVLADAFGQVWVSDAAQNLVRRWKASGETLDETGTLGREPGRFRRPATLARLGSLGVAGLDRESQRGVSEEASLGMIGIVGDS